MSVENADEGEHYIIHEGDCLQVMRRMPDCSVDSIVTDPPYGISMMGQKWDIDVPPVEVWTECLRVLKPGGHLLAFAGTRTQHRMATRIEDAGFEIRDMICWHYGCLDEQTEPVTRDGAKPYHKTKVGDDVLCYNPLSGEYSFEPILEIVEYAYSDTAYRLVGDFGEQVVSRNHRVIVERGGEEVFRLAESLDETEIVPVLEDLPALLRAVHDAQQIAGRKEQDVRADVRECDDRQGEHGLHPVGESQGEDGVVRGVRQGLLEAGCVAPQSEVPVLQSTVQRRASRQGLADSRPQRAVALEAGIRSCDKDPNDGRDESRVEGRFDVPQPQGSLREPIDQVCALPRELSGHGEEGRLHHATPSDRRASNGPIIDSDGSGASRQPRRDGQPCGELDALCDELFAQGVRAWGGHKTALVRVVPFHYTGKVWCLRVSTGSFVAVRNGVAFPTGNSGFPKSHDIGKGIDKAAGATREVVGRGPIRTASSWQAEDGRPHGMVGRAEGARLTTAPATDAAREWQGWGTALKPSTEPITLARKPLCGTIAANVQAWGTGGLNIDSCRVGTEGGTAKANIRKGETNGERAGTSMGENISFRCDIAKLNAGRWPANLIHDGECGFGEWQRYFYCAKASRADRDDGLAAFPQGMPSNAVDRSSQRDGGEPSSGRGSRSGPRANTHPTVKPTELMRYLCRLVTPPGGLVLDPFAGSGSTGRGAVLEGFRFLGIELDPEYAAMARARIDAATRVAADVTQSMFGES